MANIVKMKRSGVATKVPLAADLSLGEIAINTFDGKIYIKKDNGVVSIVEVGPVTSVAGRTGAVTLGKSDVGLGSVDNTADAAKPVSTATQSALDGKAATSHTHTASQISDATAAGRTLLTAADAAAQRTGLGLGTGALRSISVGTTAPATPALNDLWVDTN